MKGFFRAAVRGSPGRKLLVFHCSSTISANNVHLDNRGLSWTRTAVCSFGFPPVVFLSADMQIRSLKENAQAKISFWPHLTLGKPLDIWNSFHSHADLHWRVLFCPFTQKKNVWYFHGFMPVHKMSSLRTTKWAVPTPFLCWTPYRWPRRSPKRSKIFNVSACRASVVESIQTCRAVFRKVFWRTLGLQETAARVSLAWGRELTGLQPRTCVSCVREAGPTTELLWCCGSPACAL